MPGAGAGSYDRIYRVVRRIPKGRVATYGQVAELADLPRQARQVGYALHALPHGSRVPWQRVVNAKGEISQRALPGSEPLQRSILEAEGVAFTRAGRIDLTRYRWTPRPRIHPERRRGSLPPS
ncbi:MAG: methyltransferase [Deltaproteobacteria bacterium]|nr:methyltransferase [Deltaproteobacteria bacterium]